VNRALGSALVLISILAPLGFAGICRGQGATDIQPNYPSPRPSQQPAPRPYPQQPRPTPPPLQPPFPTGVPETERVRAIREAQLLIRQGKYDDALARIAAYKGEPSKSDPEIVILQGTCLRRTGRMDEAGKLYRKEADAMAARGEDPAPMLIELERVERERKDPEKAFQVCLEIHRGGRGPSGWVVDEMESLIQADSLGARALPDLRSEIERHPNADDLRDLLVSALLFLGRSQEALGAARELDQTRGAHGRVLLDHLRFLDRKALGAPAIEAADAAIAAGPKGDDFQEALYLRAGALRRMKRYPEASEAYDRAASSEPDGPLARVALRDRADLLIHEIGDLSAGSKAYEALVASLKSSPAADRGRLLGSALVALADCKLRLGRYEEAATLLADVEAQAPDAKSKEEAAYQQAEILFYAGRPDTAEMVYGRVVRQYAGGARVNDALDRILLLTRCQGAGAIPIAALGQIAYERRIGVPARAFEICQEATKICGNCAAAEDLMREESLLLLDLGKIDEAAVRADTLAARFRDGSSAPPVLQAVVDRMRARDGDTEMVIHRYEDLLARFPKSHEAFEVRALLEKTRRTGALESGPGRGRERRG